MCVLLREVCPNLALCRAPPNAAFGPRGCSSATVISRRAANESNSPPPCNIVLMESPSRARTRISDAQPDGKGLLVHEVESEFQAGQTRAKVLLPEDLEEGRRCPRTLGNRSFPFCPDAGDSLAED
jgi:hypothetical protein